jgi:hypothetical protein
MFSILSSRKPSGLGEMEDARGFLRVNHRSNVGPGRRILECSVQTKQTPGTSSRHVVQLDATLSLEVSYQRIPTIQQDGPCNQYRSAHYPIHPIRSKPPTVA